MVEITASELPKLTEETNKLTEATNKFNDSQQSSLNLFERFNSAIGGALDKFSAMGALTDSASTKLTLLTSAVLESEKSFSNITETIGSKFAGTFGRIIEQFAPAIDGFDKLSGVARSMGIDVSAADGSMADLSKMVLDAGKRLSENADYALRLQTSYLRLSAGTGELSGALDGAGDHLQNMNEILMRQAEMLGQSIKATGASKAEVVGYYQELGKVPGALAATITTGSAADQSMSMLTATMKLAAGTGRTVTDVTQSMGRAFDTFGVTGQGALEFTANISELSQKYGIKLQDVESVLTSVGGTLSKFNSSIEGGAAITKGAAEILNQYEDSLKRTGLSGKAAIDIIGGMTTAIGGMTLAQQSFLSAQSGGPGGLMGGFQIEKMLRDGNIQGVMDKVKQQMTSQMGPIVSLEEASHDQGAAAQRAKQLQILQAGPLGAMARDSQSASHLLDAMKDGKGADALGGKDFLAKSIDRGTDIQAQSYTQFTRIAANTDALQLLKGVDALKLMQSLVGTASEAYAKPSGPISTAEQGRAMGLSGAMRSATDLNRGPGSAEYKAGRDIERLMLDMPDALGASVEKIKGIFSGSGTDKSKSDAEHKEIALREADIKRRRDNALKLGDSGAVSRIDDESTRYHKAISLAEGKHSAGAKLGTAAHAGSTKDSSTEAGSPDVGGKDMHLTVHAICIHCKAELETRKSGGVSSASSR